MLREGQVDAGVIACSQSIGIVDEIKPVAEVIEGMVREAEDHSRLGGGEGSPAEPA
jgi:hypothetical protein